MKNHMAPREAATLVSQRTKIKCSHNNSDWNSSLMLRLKKQKCRCQQMMNSAKLIAFLFCSLASRMNFKLNCCGYTLCVLHTWFLWWFIGFWNIAAWYFSQRGHQPPWAPNLHSGQITIMTEFIHALELLAPCMWLTWGAACSY
jgi:hypothetical protein